MRAIARLLLHGIALWSATLVAAEWNVEMVAPGTKPEIAVGDDGTVHIAYMEESESGAVYYARRSPDGWSIETPHTGYFYAPLDIDVDGAGVVHIAYHDHDREDASLAAKDASGWTVENIAHSGHDGWDPTLVVDSAGRIHLASIDPSQFASDAGIEYALRGDRRWSVEEIGSGPIPYEFGTSIAVDSTDRPHLTYHDGEENFATSDGDLLYAVRTDDGWQIEVVDGDGDVGKFASLALDADDRAHIAYLDWRTPTTGIIKYARRVGSSWLIEEVDAVEQIAIGFLGARRVVSLALDAAGHPHLAYCDRRFLSYARFDGSTWQIETVVEETASDLDLGQLASLALDASGRPHITFYELPSPPNDSLGTIYYARGPEPTASRRNPRRTAGRAMRAVGTK